MIFIAFWKKSESWNPVVAGKSPRLCYSTLSLLYLQDCNSAEGRIPASHSLALLVPYPQWKLGMQATQAFMKEDVKSQLETEVAHLGSADWSYTTNINNNK